jgi:WD40 repeat protein
MHSPIPYKSPVVWITVAILLAGCAVNEPSPPPLLEPIPSINEEEVLPQAAARCEDAYTAEIMGGEPQGLPLYLRFIDYDSPAQWDVVHYPHAASDAVHLGFLICLSQSRIKDGTYSDGATGYQITWKVQIVDWKEGTVYREEEFDGGSPPPLKQNEGDAYGKSPYDDLMSWLSANELGDLRYIYAPGGIDDLDVSTTSSIAAIITDESLSIFEIPSLYVLSSFQADGKVNSLALSPDGKLAVIRTPAALSFLDTEMMTVVAKPGPGLERAHFSPDGRYIAMPHESNVLVMWDVEKNENMGTILPHKGRDIVAIQFSADGRFLATGGADNTIRLWDPSNGFQVFEFELDDEPSILGFSGDSNTLAAKSRYGPLIILDTETLEEIARLDDLGYAIVQLAFSPDGSFLVLGGDDGERSVWDIRSIKEVARLSGFHGRSVSAAGEMIFSPAGDLLASISQRVVRLWDTSTWRELAPLASHSDNVERAVFSADGQFLVTSSHDDTIRVWDLSQ